MKYCVYSHTNKINGKKYIGITSQKPECRWRNGRGYVNNEYFYRAIEKYGWHNFMHEILYADLCKEDAEKLEIKIIAEYKTNCNKYGYNIEAGGNGTEKFTDEIKLKISESLKGHICSEETKQKISKAKKGKPSTKKGIKLTPEQIKKNRLGHIGQQAWNKGKKWSEEEKAKFGGKAIICVETGVIYQTMHIASKQTGIDISSICACCKNKKKKAGGYSWKYVSSKGGA